MMIIAGGLLTVSVLTSLFLLAQEHTYKNIDQELKQIKNELLMMIIAEELSREVDREIIKSLKTIYYK